MDAKRFLLVILDGWGHGPDPERSAIAQANTPFVDSLYDRFPNDELVTYGEQVGLPEGQMGNSEVGHMNIGAGRIVYQELARINRAIREGDLARNEVLLNTMRYAKDEGKALHIMGLVSDGGVHSHVDHLLALCDIAAEQGLERVFLHAFTDGRDTDPKSGAAFLERVIDHIEDQPARLASIVGRYYAMDRDQRWERTRVAYDLLVKGKGEITTDPLATVRQRYEKGQTDEFLKPIAVSDDGQAPLATVRSGDAVLFFNFRTDRPRQLTRMLYVDDFKEQDTTRLDLRFVTMTRYDRTFGDIPVLFESSDLTHTLGETLSKAGKTQVRIAETEKYPHVTFFFNGGREVKFEGEDRILIPSPKVATYDLKPEMSAYEVTDAIVQAIERDEPDFICLNYANTDMVGHTGDFAAAIKAAETVDACLKRLIETAFAHDYEAIVIADHGNSDYMVNDDGSPNTAHTMNPVPIFYLHQRGKKARVKGGKLGDIAPTILHLLGMEAPEDMDGELLVSWA